MRTAIVRTVLGLLGAGAAGAVVCGALPACMGGPGRATAAAPTPTVSPAPPEVAAGPDPRLDWWRDARFGMFIHWGLYAVPAGRWEGAADGRTDHGEWIMNTAHVSVPE